MPAAAYFPAPIESNNGLRNLPGRRLNLLYPQPGIDAPNYHYYYPSGYCIPLVHPTPQPPPPGSAQFAYSDYPYFYPYPHPPQYPRAPFLIPTGSPHFYQQLGDAPLENRDAYPFPIRAYPQYAAPPGWHLQEPRTLAPLKSKSENALEDAVEGRGSYAEPFYTVVPVYGDGTKSTYEVPSYIVVPKTADENKSSNPLQWRGLPVIWKGGVPYGLVPLTSVHDGQEEDLLEPAKACIQPAQEQHQFKLADQAGTAGAEADASQSANSAPDSSPTTTNVVNSITTAKQAHPCVTPAKACIQPAQEHHQFKLADQAGTAGAEADASQSANSAPDSSPTTTNVVNSITPAKQAHPCVTPATESQIHGAEQAAKKNKEDISKVRESKSVHTKKNKEDEVSKTVAERKSMHIAWDGGVPYIVLPRVKEQGKESATEVDKKKPCEKNGNQAPPKVITAVQQDDPKKVIPVVHQDDPKKVIPVVQQDNTKSLGPNIVSEEENAEQKFLNDKFALSVINVNSSDGKEPSFAAPSTQAQMPTDQHPSTEEHSQPPIKKGYSFTRESAALRIQAAYRGHVVRIAQPLKHLKIIKDVQAGASDIYKEMENKAYALKDPAERKRISENILALLLKLDSVQGALPYVRECRKMVARGLSRAVESLDDTHQATAAPINEAEIKVMHTDQMACLPYETSDDGKKGEDINPGAKESNIMDQLHDHVDSEQSIMHDLILGEAQVNMEVGDNMVQDKMPHDHSTQINVKVEDETVRNDMENTHLGEVKMSDDSCRVQCQGGSVSDAEAEDTVQVKMENSVLSDEACQILHQNEEDQNPCSSDSLVKKVQDDKVQGKMGNLQVKVEGDDMMQVKVEGDDTMQVKMENCMSMEEKTNNEAYQAVHHNEGYDSVKVQDDKGQEKLETCMCDEVEVYINEKSHVEEEGTIQMKMEYCMSAEEKMDYEASRPAHNNEGYESLKVQKDEGQETLETRVCDEVYIAEKSDVEGGDMMQVKMDDCMSSEERTNNEASQTVHHNEGYESLKVQDDKGQDKMETSMCDEVYIDAKPCCGLETRSQCAQSDSVMNESVNEKMLEEEEVGITGDDQQNANDDCLVQMETADHETLDQVMQAYDEVGENAANILTESNKDNALHEVGENAADILTESNKDNALHEDTVVDSEMGSPQFDNALHEDTGIASELEKPGTDLVFAAAVTKNLVEDSMLCDEKLGKENTVETQGSCVSSSKDNLLSLTAENQNLVAILEKLTEWNEQQADVIRQLSERMERLEHAQGKEVDSGTDKRIGGGKRKGRANRRGRPIYCKGR